MVKPCGKAVQAARKFALVPALALMLAGVGLAGCGGVGESLGFGKQVPDEFAVVRNAPLTMPPDLALRPPRPGAQRPQEQPLRQQAENSLFDRESDAAAARPESLGETALLRQADALDTNPNIRRQINEEFTIYAQESEGFFESLLFWRADEQLGEAVDAEEEARRLSENAAVGLPPTAGDTPVIERREQALFEGIF